MAGGCQGRVHPHGAQAAGGMTFWCRGPVGFQKLLAGLGRQCKPCTRHPKAWKLHVLLAL